MDVLGSARIVVPASSTPIEPIEALRLNVSSFGTLENARNSYFIRARDVAAGKDVFAVDGLGNLTIGGSIINFTNGRTTIYAQGDLFNFIHRGGIQLTPYNDNNDLQFIMTPTDANGQVVSSSTVRFGGAGLFNNSVVNLHNTGNLLTQGKFGLGTLNPVGKFDLLVAGSSTTIQAMNIDVESFSTPQNAEVSHYLRLRDIGAGKDVFKINGFGRVMIGSTRSFNHLDYMLSVDGKLVAKEIVVTNVNWADYVFRPGYKLMSLEEVEKFILANEHLPDVPSEKEVNDNGVSLGDMDAILLKKIEEMMLYMIELKKENEQLKETTEELKKSIQLLQENE